MSRCNLGEKQWIIEKSILAQTRISSVGDTPQRVLSKSRRPIRFKRIKRTFMHRKKITFGT
jgi:hypothetical protein